MELYKWSVGWWCPYGEQVLNSESHQEENDTSKSSFFGETPLE